jgi:hypothetical protein
MARTSLVIGLITMSLHIDHCSLFYLKITSLEEELFLLPGRDLDVTGDI